MFQKASKCKKCKRTKSTAKFKKEIKPIVNFGRLKDLCVAE